METAADRVLLGCCLQWTVCHSPGLVASCMCRPQPRMPLWQHHTWCAMLCSYCCAASSIQHRRNHQPLSSRVLMVVASSNRARLLMPAPRAPLALLPPGRRRRLWTRCRPAASRRLQRPDVPWRRPRRQHTAGPQPSAMLWRDPIHADAALHAFQGGRVDVVGCGRCQGRSGMLQAMQL